MGGRFLRAILWAVFLLGLLELASRTLLFPQYTAMLPDMYVPHPVLGHYNKPNVAVRRYNPMNYDTINHTNSLGMRGREQNRERELNGIWIMGGSNTYGGYVADDEIFSAALARHGHTAANLASEGHNIAKQALMVRYLSQEGYRPKAVLLVASMYFVFSDYSNDFDLLNAPLASVPTASAKSQRLRPRDQLASALSDLESAVPTSMQSVKARLLKSSAFYGWLKVGIMGIPALRNWTLEIGLRNDLDYVQNFDLELLRPLTPDNPATPKVTSTADFVAAIGEMVREGLDVPFGVVLLPAHLQLHPKSFDRYVEHYRLGDQDLDPLRPLMALHNELSKRGLRVLDAYPALKESGEARLTFPDDGHLNAKAHSIVAAAIARWLDGWLTAAMKRAAP